MCLSARSQGLRIWAKYISPFGLALMAVEPESFAGDLLNLLSHYVRFTIRSAQHRVRLVIIHNLFRFGIKTERAI